MRVTNWVIRSVPWDVRSKRRKQKQKTPKKNFKKKGNATSVECFMGLFSPCWLACQKQNLHCIKQVSMNTTASSHNAPLYSSILASPIGLVGVGSLTIRTQIFLPFCETPNVRPIVPSKLPCAPQNHIFKSPKPDEKRGNHTHMKVTNWVTRSVPWDVRSKRRKQKHKFI